MQLPEIFKTDYDFDTAVSPSYVPNIFGLLYYQLACCIHQHIKEHSNVERLYKEQLANLDIQLDALNEVGFLKEGRSETGAINVHYIDENTSDISYRNTLNFPTPREIYSQHIITIPARFKDISSFLKYAMNPDRKSESIETIYIKHKRWIDQIIALDSKLSLQEKFDLFMFNTMSKN